MENLLSHPEILEEIRRAMHETNRLHSKLCDLIITLEKHPLNRTLIAETMHETEETEYNIELRVDRISTMIDDKILYPREESNDF